MDPGVEWKWNKMLEEKLVKADKVRSLVNSVILIYKLYVLLLSNCLSIGVMWEVNIRASWVKGVQELSVLPLNSSVTLKTISK